jgi:hypothetical protein
MISRSRALPIGAQGLPPGSTNLGVIEITLDLQAQFGIGDSTAEHSAFFSRPIQTIWLYYDQVLKDCLIPRTGRQ